MSQFSGGLSTAQLYCLLRVSQGASYLELRVLFEGHWLLATLISLQVEVPVFLPAVRPGPSQFSGALPLLFLGASKECFPDFAWAPLGDNLPLGNSESAG